MNIILDVKNKSLGRAASEAAILLRSKNKADFLPNALPKCKVIVKNSSVLRFTGKKFKNKLYKNYSGYPGGLKFESMEKLFSRKPKEVFRRAVLGMLPKNKQRKTLINNLIIE